MSEKHDIDHLFQQRLQNAAVTPPDFVWPNVERALRRRRRRFLAWMLIAGLAGSAALWLCLERPGQAVATTGAEKSPETARTEPTPAAGQTEPATAIRDTGATASFAAETPAGSLSGAAAAGPTSPSGIRTAGSARTAATKTPDAAAGSRSAPAHPLPGVIVPADPAPGLPADADSPAFFKKQGVLAALAGRPAWLNKGTDVPLPPVAVAQTPARKRRPRKNNCYDFAKSPNAWLVDAYAGPSFARKTLRANADDRPYLNQRLATERPDWAYNAGLRASWLFNRHFVLRTGLHYQQITEVFEFIDPNSVIVTYQVENGDTTILDIDYGENYVKTFNRFGLLDIPLQAGVEWRQGNGGIALNAGVSLNLLFWKRGEILAPGANTPRPASFTPGQGNSIDVFRRSAGLSLNGSAQFFYHLQPRLRLFAEPYYHHILKPLNHPGHPVEQRYGIGGIRLGATAILD